MKIYIFNLLKHNYLNIVKVYLILLFFIKSLELFNYSIQVNNFSKISDLNVIYNIIYKKIIIFILLTSNILIFLGTIFCLFKIKSFTKSEKLFNSILSYYLWILFVINLLINLLSLIYFLLELFDNYFNFLYILLQIYMIYLTVSIIYIFFAQKLEKRDIDKKIIFEEEKKLIK